MGAKLDTAIAIVAAIALRTEIVQITDLCALFIVDSTLPMVSLRLLHVKSADVSVFACTAMVIDLTAMAMSCAGSSPIGAPASPARASTRVSGFRARVCGAAYHDHRQQPE